MRNQGRCRLLIGVLLCFAALLPVGQAGERMALVIGNSDYADRSVFPDLDLAAKDARLVADTLEELGFEVIFVEDATKTVLYNRLLDFEEKIEKGGAALFYYAGHGVEFEKKNYLTGTNALFRDRDLLGEETMDADVIIGKMLRAEPKTAMVFLDCCREPPPQSWLTSHKKTRGANTLGLAPMQTRPGLVVGFSASAGNLANDTLGGEFGPYATALTKFMKTGEEINRVLQLTGREVNRLSQEVKAGNPKATGLVIQEPAVYGQIYHDFFFSPGGKPATGKLTSAELAERDRMIADLQKKLAAMESKEPTMEDYERAKAKAERVKKLFEMHAASREEYDQALDELARATPKSMKRSEPEAGNSFSANRGMEGSKAGEVREFGGIEFVWCPPGEFMMGSPEDELGRDQDEPRHSVKLTKGFWAAKTECTQAQWGLVMTENPSQAQQSDFPVTDVTWSGADGWVRKMNERFPIPGDWIWELPTEAQWEYFCRSGSSTTFSCGERLSKDYANFSGSLLAVGSLKPNAWGIYDAHANAYEWCRDWYQESSYKEGAIDPKGPSSGTHRVARGGCWSFSFSYARSANRSAFEDYVKNGSLGFRPVIVPSR